MVVKIMFNEEKPGYFRFVECDTLHCEMGVDFLKLIMYKSGKMIESPEFFTQDPTSVHVFLLENGTVIDKFRLNSNTKLPKE